MPNQPQLSKPAKQQFKPTPKEIKVVTKPKVRKRTEVAKAPSRRFYAIKNTSNSDFELIVLEDGKAEPDWMTPHRVIHVPLGPLTPQVEEFKRRQMVSVTEVHR